MDGPTMAVFSGSANPQLSHDIARYLQVPLGRAHVGRFSDGDTDGLGAVDDAFGNRPRPCRNLVQDFHRVFSARVITGNDDTIGLLACQLTHDRALAGVAIAATAEHAHQPPLARTHRRAQGL